MHEDRLRIDIFVMFINYQKKGDEMRKKLLNCHWPLQFVEVRNPSNQCRCPLHVYWNRITEVQRIIWKFQNGIIWTESDKKGCKKYMYKCFIRLSWKIVAFEGKCKNRKNIIWYKQKTFMFVWLTLMYQTDWNCVYICWANINIILM